MKIEKWLLTAAVLYMVAMATALIMRTALVECEYDVQKMFVGRGVLVAASSTRVPYRLKTKRSPFREKTEFT